ncbi:hypothetical protein D516_2148 [Rhodobacter sp. AKP1]|nr:hypothetical protein D516_2148 [Rhodobacter sp. AKP1]
MGQGRRSRLGRGIHPLRCRRRPRGVKPGRPGPRPDPLLGRRARLGGHGPVRLPLRVRLAPRTQGKITATAPAGTGEGGGTGRTLRSSPACADPLARQIRGRASRIGRQPCDGDGFFRMATVRTRKGLLRHGRRSRRQPGSSSWHGPSRGRVPQTCAHSITEGLAPANRMAHTRLKEESRDDRRLPARRPLPALDGRPDRSLHDPRRVDHDDRGSTAPGAGHAVPLSQECGAGRRRADADPPCLSQRASATASAGLCAGVAGADRPDLPWVALCAPVSHGGFWLRPGYGWRLSAGGLGCARAAAAFQTRGAGLRRERGARGGCLRFDGVGPAACGRGASSRARAPGWGLRARVARRRTLTRQDGSAVLPSARRRSSAAGVLDLRKAARGTRSALAGSATELPAGTGPAAARHRLGSGDAGNLHHVAGGAAGDTGGVASDPDPVDRPATGVCGG